MMGLSAKGTPPKGTRHPAPRCRAGATIIGISPRTLARMTARGEGPPCLDLGFKRLRRYPVVDLRRYLALEIKNVLNPNEPKRKESA